MVHLSRENLRLFLLINKDHDIEIGIKKYKESDRFDDWRYLEFSDAEYKWFKKKRTMQMYVRLYIFCIGRRLEKNRILWIVNASYIHDISQV